MKEIVLDVGELVFSAGDVGDIHVVGGRAKFFELLASEDINGNQVNLGVAVLSSLRCAHLDNLAGAVFDNDVPMEGSRNVNIPVYHNETSDRCRNGGESKTYPFLRSAEHCMGNVAEAPAEADSKVWLCYKTQTSVLRSNKASSSFVVLSMCAD